MLPHLKALILGSLGAALFFACHIPLPFMLGPMVLCTIATQKGWSIRPPDKIMPAVRTLIGVTIGASFTPSVIASIPDYLPSLALVPFAALLTIFSGIIILTRVMKLDTRTALYGASPGSLAVMVTQAEESGADAKQVALLHSLRLVLLLTCLPLISPFLPGLQEVVTTVPNHSSDLPEQYGMIVAASLTGGILARKLKIPGGIILVPMFLSAMLYGFGTVEAHLPFWVRAGAQICLGITLGCRMQALSRRELIRSASVALFMLLVAMVIDILCALASAYLTGVSVANGIISFAPGGITEMSLLAIGLGLNPGFVALHHTFRVVFLSISAPFLHKLFDRPPKDT